MAITRAQQARQLYRNGSRPEFKLGMSPGRAQAEFGNIDRAGTPERGDNDGPNRQQKAPKRKPKKTKKNTAPTLNPFERFRLAGLKNLYDQKAGLKTPAIGFSNLLNYANPSLDFYESTSDTDIMDTGYGLSGKNLTDMDRLADAINLGEKTGNLNQRQFEEAFYGPEGNKFIPNEIGENDIYIPPVIEEEKEEKEEEDVPISYRFMADGGRAAFQEGGIMPRLNELGSSVSSAEQMLQGINQKLKSAESSLGQPSGGGGIMDSSIVPDAPAVEATPFPAITPDAPIADKTPATPDFSFQTTNTVQTNNQNIGGGRVPGGPENPNIDIGLISGPRPAVDLPGGMQNNMSIPQTFLQGGAGPRIPILPPKVNTSISHMGNMPTFRQSLQTAQPGSLVQVAGNPIQEAMRGSFADGGMPEYQGGIMDLESGRQQYFLGKLVKKATRAVKKVVKSPFGKALLLGGLTFGVPGVSSGFFSKGLMGTKSGLGFKNFLANKVLGNPVGDSGGLLNFIKNNPGKSILGASALTGLLASQEEEDEGLDRGEGIDIEAIRNSPYRYLAPRFMADGGRINYSEAGEVLSKKEIKKISKSPLYKGFKRMYGVDPSMAKDNNSYKEKFDLFEKIYKQGLKEGGEAEPVAKETMPLLDMGGKEMDLRAEGGFVPIGRMEKADDVPARLSKNEFVFTADAVRNAGEGDIDKGAEVMYNMMKNLESGGEVSEESQGLDGAKEMFQTSKRLEEVL